MSATVVKDQVCRICRTLVGITDLRDSQAGHVEANNISLSAKVFLCTGIDLLATDEATEAKVCVTCESDILHLYEFREKCEQSLNYFCNEEPKSVILEPAVDIKIELDEVAEELEIVQPSSIDEQNTKLNEIYFKCEETGDFLHESDNVESETEDETNNDENVDADDYEPQPQNAKRALNKKREGETNKEKTLKDADSKFHCDVCEMTFEQASVLNTHLKNKHIDYKPYFCHKCYLQFPLLKEFNSHLCKPAEGTDVKYEKITEDVYKCKECNKSYESSETEIIFHIYNHLQPKNWNCYFCDLAYAKRRELISHIKQRHLGNFLLQLTNETKNTKDGWDHSIHQIPLGSHIFFDPIGTGRSNLVDRTDVKNNNQLHGFALILN